MKKILSFCAAMLVAFAASAAVVNITPDGSTDLRHAVRDLANAGDTVVLADGTYTQGGNYTYFDKNLVVMAAKGAKPVVKFTVPAQIKSGARAEFIGIKFDMENLHGQSWYEHLIYASDATDGNVLVFDGCEFYNDTLNNSVIYCSSSNKLDSIIVKNCKFYDIMKSCIFVESTNFQGLHISNSTFYNISTNSQSYKAGVNDIRATGAELRVDNCTFYNVLPMNSDYSCVSKVTLANGIASNCIFMLPEAMDGYRAMRGVTANNCITFNYLKDSGTGIHSSVTKNNCTQADPLFVNAANGDFTLGEGSPALTMNNGEPIGDPRWWPTAAPALEPKTFYGATSFMTEGTIITPATWAGIENNITRNADKTLTFVAEFTNAVTGLVAQINLGAGYQNMTADGLKFTYTTTDTYEDGAALEGAFFYFPYAGAAKRVDIAYTVGAENEKPATPEDVRMHGTYHVGGDNADYTTLSAAIQDIEDNGMSADVTLLICADLSEGINIGITNSTEFTLTIAPDAAVKRTITYGSQTDNVGPSGHIIIGTTMAKDFNTTIATKNVIIDGSFEGEGQYLEFVGGDLGGNVIVIYGNVTYTTIRNCRIIHPRTNGTNYAIQFRSEKSTDNGPEGIVVENCLLQTTGSTNTQTIYFNGSQASSAAGYPKNIVIRNNEILSNLRGVFFNKADGAVFEGNTFRIANASAAFLAHGIMGNAQSGTIIVRGNKFIEMGSKNTNDGEYGLCGITASGGSDVWIIENNIFAGLDAKAALSNKAITLRYIRCGDSCVVRHNTFYVPVLTNKPATDLVTASPICALYLAGARQYDVENNIFVSMETEANNSLIRGALNPNVKNNVFYHAGGNAAILAGAVVAADSAAFFALEGTAGSVWKAPIFVDAPNGDLALNAADNDLKMPKIDGIDEDINGTLRANETYAGAYEFVQGDDYTVGLDNINATDAARKVMIDGKLFIIKGDAVYTITGVRVK